MNMLKKYVPERNARNRLMTRAQGLAEFALILPVLLVVLFVLIELARVLHAWLAVENGARQGIRYAVTMEYDPSKCGSPLLEDGTCPEADVPEARLASIHDAAWYGSSSIVRVKETEANADQPSYFHVVVCRPEDLIDPADASSPTTCAPNEEPGGPGDQIVIVVEFNHPILLPILSSIAPEIRLTSKREARIETFRVPLPADEKPALPTTTPKPTVTAKAPVPKPTCSMISAGGLNVGSTALSYEIFAVPSIYSGYNYKVELSDVNVWVYANDCNHDPSQLQWEGHSTGFAAGMCSLNDDDLMEHYFEAKMASPWAFSSTTPGASYQYHGTLKVSFNHVLDGAYSIQSIVTFPDFGIHCSVSRDYSTDTDKYPFPAPPSGPYTPPEPNPPEPNPPNPDPEPIIPPD
jgi:hypothetical protein